MDRRNQKLNVRFWMYPSLGLKLTQPIRHLPQHTLNCAQQTLHANRWEKNLKITDKKTFGRGKNQKTNKMGWISDLFKSRGGRVKNPWSGRHWREKLEGRTFWLSGGISSSKSGTVIVAVSDLTTCRWRSCQGTRKLDLALSSRYYAPNMNKCNNTPFKSFEIYRNKFGSFSAERGISSPSKSI